MLDLLKIPTLFLFAAISAIPSLPSFAQSTPRMDILGFHIGSTYEQIKTQALEKYKKCKEHAVPEKYPILACETNLKDEREIIAFAFTQHLQPKRVIFITYHFRDYAHPDDTCKALIASYRPHSAGCRSGEYWSLSNGAIFYLLFEESPEGGFIYEIVLSAGRQYLDADRKAKRDDYRRKHPPRKF